MMEEATERATVGAGKKWTAAKKMKRGDGENEVPDGTCTW
jgi:hypothetical protein